MTRHHAFASVDCDPKDLPKWKLKKLAKGRVSCLFGPSKGTAVESDFTYSQSNNKNIKDNDDGKEIDDYDNDEKDDFSQSSADHDDDDDEVRLMKIKQCGDSSLSCWKLEEYGSWMFEATQ